MAAEELKATVAYKFNSCNGLENVIYIHNGLEILGAATMAQKFQGQPQWLRNFRDSHNGLDILGSVVPILVQVQVNINIGKQYRADTDTLQTKF